ncbi:helix-turn-helix domain-containing protein [Heliobacillus mobilis]|uniref:Helix-turn-helix domain-containing protein n=2 Tax=Heliobacterium mobile TaxID=28064 RepID=A0A6I3SGD6_HELMO|nr:helix-turn-helix domain-containing protein [Heliobacterium mobile]
MNLTAQELSEASGVNKATIGSIENDRHKPELRILKLLAKPLGLSAWYLGCYDLLPEDTLGQRIKKIRLMNECTLAEFAKLVGVDIRTVRLWEKNIHKPLSRFLEIITSLKEWNE